MKSSLIHIKRAMYASVMAGGIAFAVQVMAAEKRIAIATGPAGGVYLPLGKGMAEVLGKYLTDVKASHEATSASADNIRMVADGKVEVAFTQADTAWDAFKGYNKFDKPLPIRTLAVIYPNHLHLVTLRDNGIVKVSDLRGKRVSTGAAGSGTEIWGLRLLEAHGIDPDKDVKREKLALQPSIDALKEQKIEAFIWASGTPAKAIADYAKMPYRVAMKEPQWLIVGEQRWSFREFAPSGDRLLLKARFLCADSRATP